MSEVAPVFDAPMLDARRGALWLPFLRRLTELSPQAVVWKNASPALAGHGDLDVIAPASDWIEIEGEFRRWAAAAGLQFVLVCRHVPGSIFMLAADPARPAFLELDIKDTGRFRGTTIFRASDLQHLAELDSRGFRRLRPGAEGLLKLILNGTTDDAGLNPHRVARERVIELLDSDRAGAEHAAKLFKSAGPHALALADGFVRGEWDRSRMIALRTRLRLRLVLEPGYVARRLWARIRPGRTCDGVKSMIKDGRLAPGDRNSLQELVRAHRAAPGAAT